jgi:hypothetical protein
MRTYARILNGRVVELATTGSNISTMFHPALVWVDASSMTDIEEGWTYDGSVFARSTVPEILPPVLSMSALQTQLAFLTAQLAALSKAT